ncbi:ABC transporter permease [Desulfobacula phenolica]|uniref:Transport permease protein n=1 Tax=Desulfobacula phenolica TaxID=90732 RepID=A0A1H2ICJ5_9BACT|nr:ABC transporter permease [Desulfobacula phenolica]SDU41725.1 ABC-2 type transporter, NodJ family [Desulfobacula phenolica]
MIQGAFAVYYRELLILRRRLSRLIPSWSVSPLLYLIAFGYAMGKHVAVDGHTYMEFLIPGLIAMSSMTQAFSISSEINIARFYWHIFEEIQAAPVSDLSYVTGEVLAGMTRAFLAIAVILVLGLLFGVVLSLNVWFWLAIVLNSFVFASLAVGLAMLVKSHADQTLLTSFVITPMAFLGGTFFPVENFPAWAQKVIFLLPLTHAATAIRTASFGDMPSLSSLFILAAIGSMFFYISVLFVKKAKD